MKKQIQRTTTSKSAAATDEQVKVWNVLIYMAADNNLKEECMFALTEILKAGATPGIDVIAQFDSGDAITQFDFSKLPKNIGKYDRKTLEVGKIAETILSDPKAILNVSDTQMLNDFLSQRLGKPEDQHYNMIILSGHGSGAVGDFLANTNPPSALSIPGLKLALESACEQIGRKIDVLGMDSCLMSMIEVCYELRNEIDFLIGAEGFERSTGWPYLEILEVLKSNLKVLAEDSEASLEELTGAIVSEYVRYYFPYHLSGVSVDLAACDLRDSNNVDTLKAFINRLAEALRDNLDDQRVKNAVLVAHWKAQSYKFEQYVDLWDFCHLLRSDLLNGVYGEDDPGSDWDKVKSAIESACWDVMTAVEAIAKYSCYSGAAFQHSHGLSIYFPWAKSDLDRDLEHYRKLAFAKATQWDEFLEVYGRETQREVRDDGNKGIGGEKPIPMPSRPEAGTTVRVNVQAGERVNVQAGERVGRVVVAQVKNEPTSFYKDDCG